MDALKTKAYTNNLWTNRMEEQYNALDKEATQIMLAAERNCFPNTFGAFAWSKRLTVTGLKLRYIMLNILEKQKGRIPEYVMEKARTRANSENIENKRKRNYRQ